MKPNQPDSIGTVLKDLQRRMKIAETSPQLTSASIKDGRLRILDENFDERAQFGRLDGGDLDGDGDQDWGLVIFDEAGDWAFLGTKAGVFVRGKIQGGTIDIGGSDASSFHVDADGRLWLGAALFADGPFRVDANGDLTVEGGTIVGSNIETAPAPGARVKVTDDAPAPYDAAVQFFTGTEPAGAQGAVAQYVDSITGRAILFVGPSGLAGSGLANRAAIFVVSKKPDGTGDREILLIAGEKLYVEAALAQFTGDVAVAGGLSVGGGISVTGDSSVTGGVIVDGDEAVIGGLTVGDGATVTGDSSVTGGFIVTGSQAIYGGLQVGGRDTDGQSRGAAFAGTTDGSGDLVVAHGMGAVPTGVGVTMGVTSAFGAALVNPVVVNLDATNVQIRFYNSSTGAALVGADMVGYVVATR